MINNAELVRVTIAIAGFHGISSNLVLFGILFTIRLGSTLTISLFRALCIADWWTCFSAFLYQLIGKEIRTGKPEVDKFLCYLWFADSLIWLGVVSSIYNLVCISFDRLLAVGCPVAYKRYNIRFTYGCFLFVFLMTVFLYFPNFLARDYVDGSCRWISLHQNEELRQFFRVEAIVWMVLNYLFPVLFYIGSHCFVIRKLNQIGVFSSPPVDANGTSSTDQGNGKRRRLIVTTVIIVTMIIIFNSYDTILYLLSFIDITDYGILSARQQVGVLLIVFRSSTTPYIYLSTIPPARRRLRKLFHRCWACFRGKNSGVSVNSVTSLPSE